MNTPSQPRLSYIVSTFGVIIVLVLLRIDAILALVLGFVFFSVLLTIHFRFRARHRLIALLPVLLVASVIIYRYVSWCSFITCTPVGWSVQLAAAQQAIDRIGSGFQAVDVWSSNDTLSPYRSNGNPNRSVTVFFARPEVLPDGSYPYYSVDLNDRDPVKSASVTGGVAYGRLPSFTKLAPLFDAIKLSPREALLALYRQVPSVEGLSNPTIVLALHEHIPGRGDHPVAWRIISNKDTSFYIDGETGAYIGAKQGNVSP